MFYSKIALSKTLFLLPMKYSLRLLIVFLLSFQLINAQEDWQQTVNHTIEVSLNDTNHRLIAIQKVEYINNSPDTLEYIYFHLWPNAYKNNSTAFAKQKRIEKANGGTTQFHFSKKEEKGFMYDVSFKSGTTLKHELDSTHIDICKVILNKPLFPGQRITLENTFNVQLPASFSRLGHEGQSYQISQWFPKPAVYNLNGWHPFPYLDQGEFFYEYGKYDVSITLPENYTVGATGVLQNADEIKRMNKLAEKSKNTQDFKKEDSYPASSKKMKTLRYVQDNVHDFAWFADKRFNVWKSEITLPNSGRKVTSWQLFLNSSADEWIEGITDIDTAIYYYSLWVGDYPYDHVTAVDGALSAGGGMEYPMVTVTLQDAIIHEVGHNWFYGILGSNERKYPWMDEGFNTYIENRIHKLQNKKNGLVDGKIGELSGISKFPKHYNMMWGYQSEASRNLDQAIQLHSTNYTSMNYGTMVYYKSTVALNYLQEYLGEDLMNKCLQTYFNRWKFQHPYPKDVKAIFEEVTNQDLSWFFDHLITTTKSPDFKASQVEVNDDFITVTIHNTGAVFPTPVQLVDSNHQVLATKWTKPVKDETVLSFPKHSGATAVWVDANMIVPEINKNNNYKKITQGKKWKLTPFKLVENPTEKHLYFLPLVGYNTSDKLMLGVNFYNSLFQQKRINFHVAPMYAFGSAQLNGFGDINYRFNHPKPFNDAKVGLRFRKFLNIQKFEPYLTIKLARKSPAKPAGRIDLSMPIFKDGSNFIFASYQLDAGNSIVRNIGKAEFEYFNQQYNRSFYLKLENKFSYQYLPRKHLDLRIFAVTHLLGNKNLPYGISNSLDRAFQQTFLDRSMNNNNIFSGFHRQTFLGDGGFRGNIPVFSNELLLTTNLTANLPKVPFTVFADLGYVKNASPLFTDLSNAFFVPEDQFVFDAGIGINLVKGVFEIYAPVIGDNFTSTTNKTPTNFSDFLDNIRWMLKLDIYRLNDIIDEMLRP